MKLCDKTCKSCEGGVDPLSHDQVHDCLKQLDQWQLSSDHKKITKIFSFKNYFETMAFVNATAWISHQENHHPDLSVHYNRCVVEYTTHAIDGLSENDFICAAKIDGL